MYCHVQQYMALTAKWHAIHLKSQNELRSICRQSNCHPAGRFVQGAGKQNGSCFKYLFTQAKNQQQGIRLALLCNRSVNICLTSTPACRRDDSCYRRVKSDPSRLRDLFHCSFNGFRLTRSGEFRFQHYQPTGTAARASGRLGGTGIPTAATLSSIGFADNKFNFERGLKQ